MQACLEEAFWYRAMPSALLAGSSVYLAVKSGKLKPNSRLGPWPKVVGLGSLAYLVAKMSYIFGDNCVGKLKEKATTAVGSGGGKRGRETAVKMILGTWASMGEKGSWGGGRGRCHGV